VCCGCDSNKTCICVCIVNVTRVGFMCVVVEWVLHAGRTGNAKAKAVCCLLKWVSAVAFEYKSADTGRQAGTLVLYIIRITQTNLLLPNSCS
jgi:hypothetical protein